MKQTRSLLPILIVSCLSLAWFLGWQNLAWPGENDFSFLVLADTHGDAASVLDDASVRYGKAITFIAGTGDNSPVTNYRGWDGLDEKVHRAFGAGFPWFSSLGNHNADNPTDMTYILNVIMPRFPTQLPGISNLNMNGLPHTDISIKAFGVF